MGNGFLQSVKIRNLVSGEITERAIDGVFIFIGYVPNTEKFVGRVQLNSGGEVVVNSSLETNVQGVYAAGDSIQKKYRQVTTAVADGTIAALSAIGHLHNHRANQLEKAL
jgi:thioredoxin reductase (NADPH)